MASILPGFEYDIFISYRQNDNKQDGWVSEFVRILRSELEATVKNPVSIYFDENPHDGLLDTHLVDSSLAKKLKCLIFVPIVSQTYCDPDGFAWQHEFLPFIRMASADEIGMHIDLLNGNVVSRVLPIQIHDLDQEDLDIIEGQLGGPLRSIPFIFKAPGVNRPLRVTDADSQNLNKTQYRNQINKVANALKEIGRSMVKAAGEKGPKMVQAISEAKQDLKDGLPQKSWWEMAKKRNVPRAGIAYLVVAWLVLQMAESLTRIFSIPQWVLVTAALTLAAGLPVALMLAWRFERAPTGFIRAGTTQARDNPYGPAGKKPFSSNTVIAAVVLSIIVLSVVQRFWLGNARLGSNEDLSIAIIPFQDYSESGSHKNLGVGMASEVRTALSLSKKFQFISSLQATLQYSNSKESPKVMGRDLGVTHILSGYYNISGSSIQVTVELVDTKDGSIIWSLPYKAPVSDVFNIQEDIASKVLDRFAFNSSDTGPVASTNLPAYSHYLRGVEIFNRGWNEDLFAEATQEFETAIQLDSTYLPAWVELINTTTTWMWEFKAADSNLFRKAKRNIEYVHKHFPISWQTKLADGVYQYHGLSNYDEGLRLFTEVLEEDPENLIANGLAAAIYKRRMDFGRSIRLLSKAKQQWPQSVVTWSEIQEVMMSTGDYEMQDKVIKMLLDLGGTDIGKNRAFWAAYQTGTLENLPMEVKKWGMDAVSPGGYEILVNSQKRDWNAVKFTLDTMKKSGPYGRMLGYYGAGRTDSCRRIAKRYLAGVKADPSRFRPNIAGMSYAMLGRKDKAMVVMDSLWFNNSNLVKIKKEDLLMQARQRIAKVVVLAMAGDYPSATRMLQSVNKDFPNYGDFRPIYSDPVLDRIKKEYPPFNETISGLKLPQKLVLEKIIKL